MLDLHPKYLIFLGGEESNTYAKTGRGVATWRKDLCVGELRLDSEAATVGLPEVTLDEAVAAGAKTVIVGLTGIGGKLHPSWIPALVAALEAGLDVAAGLHHKLKDQPELVAAAKRSGQRPIDVRVPPKDIEVGSGLKRTGKRVLTVGTDCALGKKYTALALHKGLEAQGVNATFRATGQTGIMISGSGIPMDSVVVDFASGAAEMLSPDNDPDHWDVIEGQGSLFHPGFAAVSLGLLHGSQPDVLVLCHEAGRETINGYPHYKLPGLADCIRQTLDMARLTNRDVVCAAVSLHTGKLDEPAARTALKAAAEAAGVPAFDPIRDGPEGLAAAVLAAGA